MKHQHDGFSDNVGNGQDLDDADSISARFKLLFQPSDTFSATLTAQHFEEDVNGQAQKGIFVDAWGSGLAQDSSPATTLESLLSA